MLSINQPYFFPNIGYFYLLKCSSNHVFLDNVRMRKKSFITRNYLASLSLDITLPVSHLSQNRNINDHFIHDKNIFYENFFQTIKNAYKDYMYVSDLVNILDSIFNFVKDADSVSQFNQISTKQICRYLEIDVVFTDASDLQIPDTYKQAYLLIEICKALGILNYINLEGGRDLYDEHMFYDHGIRLNLCNNQSLRLFFPDKIFYTSILDLIALKGVVWISKNLETALHLQGIGKLPESF